MTDSDQEYLNWIDGFEKWYGNSVRRWLFTLYCCRILTFASSAGATILAALATGQSYGELKTIIVLASALGTASSTLMAEFRVSKMEMLRELGRQEAAHLAAYARDKFEEFGDDAIKKHRIRDEIRERIRKLEEAQAQGFGQVNQGQLEPISTNRTH